MRRVVNIRLQEEWTFVNSEYQMSRWRMEGSFTFDRLMKRVVNIRQQDGERRAGLPLIG